MDYSSGFETPRDQGPDGTCVAHACVHLKDYQERKERGDPNIMLSTRRLYDMCKAVDGLPGSGTFYRVALKICQNVGVCLESCCPYSADGPVPPCAEWETQAAEYKIQTYARVEIDPDQICQALATFGPILGGVEVTGEWTKTKGHIGVVAGARRIGGHAICLTGYDRAAKEIKFINSWGTSWGEGGYGYLSFDYLVKYGLDFWSVVDIIVPRPDQTT